MQLTRASEYGLRGMLYLARREANTRRDFSDYASLTEIAQAENISRKFLARLFKMLTEEGLIRVQRGKNGGYRLARRPREISMLSIVEAIEGPIMINQCLGNPSCCNQSAVCPMMSVWGEAQRKFLKELKSMTLEKLVRKERRG